MARDMVIKVDFVWKEVDYTKPNNKPFLYVTTDQKEYRESEVQGIKVGSEATEILESLKNLSKPDRNGRIYAEGSIQTQLIDALLKTSKLPEHSQFNHLPSGHFTLQMRGVGTVKEKDGKRIVEDIHHISSIDLIMPFDSGDPDERP